MAGFVATVHSAKIEIERKMRKELDQKLMGMGVGQVFHALGKDLVKRLRFYIRKMLANQIKQAFVNKPKTVTRKGVTIKMP